MSDGPIFHPSNNPGASLGEIFTYHPPTHEQQIAYANIRHDAQVLAATILGNCPPCADTTAAIRKVREAVMTANAAVALAVPTNPGSAR